MKAFIVNKRTQEERLARQVSMLARKTEEAGSPELREEGSGEEGTPERGRGARRDRERERGTGSPQGRRKGKGLDLESFAVCKMVTVLDDPSVDKVAKEGLFMRQFEAASELIKVGGDDGGWGRDGWCECGGWGCNCW